MKTALVTAIYGGYDRLKPLPPDHGFDQALLYTDDILLAEAAGELGWQAVVDTDPTGRFGESRMLKAKYWKTQPHIAAPDADVSVWLDGSMRITADRMAERCLNALGDDDLSMTLHPARTCIYPEAEVTASLARYADCNPMAQVAHYRDTFGHPANWGLFASGAAVRRHNDRVAGWGQRWWVENVARTYQDQLSLPVITRELAETKGLTFNTNMPWGQWWELSEHGI